MTLQAQIEVLTQCDERITRKLNTALASRRQDAITKAAGLMEALNIVKSLLNDKRSALRKLEENDRNQP